MTIEFIGSTGIGGGNQTQNYDFDYDATAGNMVAIIGHFWNSGGDSCFLTDIHDDAGNTWHYATSDSTSPPAVSITATGDGFQTNWIAWTFQDVGTLTHIWMSREDASGGWYRFAMAEFQPCYFDNSNARADSTPAASYVSPAVNIHQADSLVLASVDALETGVDSSNVWTEFAGYSAGGNGGDLCLLDNPTVGNGFTDTWDATSGTTRWSGAIAVFTPSPPTVPVNITGVAAIVTLAGGVGSPSGEANAQGSAAAITMNGGIGSVTADVTVDITGSSASIVMAGGIGSPAGEANVQGTSAPIVMVGGIGSPSGEADVTGVSAVLALAGGVGVVTADSGAIVSGVGAQVILASVGGKVLLPGKINALFVFSQV